MLKYAPDAEPAGGGGAVIGNLPAIGADGAGVGPKHPSPTMHQRRVSGAVMPNQPQPLTPPNAQGDTGQRPDGAEAFSDIIEKKCCIAGNH